jgi:molybdopterin-synthase adenylyltransferase
MFEYNEFISRNIGFVDEDEQTSIQRSRVLVVGVGGMGGAAIACLARAGIENFLIADIDVFEISNLNRQIFSKMSVIGHEKVKVVQEELKEINPNIHCEIVQGSWLSKLDDILPSCNLVINGCDDIRATIQLMRKAKEYRRTVIDAFACTLPNVYVVKPSDPRPENFLRFQTESLAPETLTDAQVALCAQCETEYVLTHSSTSGHVVLDKAAEMISGKRKRISFAPMVWMTGTLMAYEAIKIILNSEDVASYRGVFYNPYKHRVEQPLGVVASNIKRRLVRSFMNRIKQESSADEST